MNKHHHIDNDSREAQRVTLIGALINLVLAILKVIVGHIGHSAALVADGIHSLSDLASDVIVMLATRHGRQPADDDHPYGHQRIETVATVILGSMLVLVALGIAWDASIRVLNRNDLHTPDMLVILVATLSLASKEWLYRYTMRVANHVNSRLLEANAWHHRSDAISSFIVLIGVAGAMAGLPILDAVAAFLVALMIIQIAWELMSSSVKELVDTAVDEDTLKQIRSLITQTDGIVSLHLLRTRRMGSNILVDAHLQVSPRLSVSEGHQIAEHVRDQLIHQMSHIQDVTIHIDPENDETGPVNNHLPLRQKLLRALNSDWSNIPEANYIQDIALHYLDGKVEVEILLPFPKGGGTEAKQIQTAFSKASGQNELVSVIRVRYT